MSGQEDRESPLLHADHPREVEATLREDEIGLHDGRPAAVDPQRPHSRDFDEVAAAFASRQHGVVTCRQLLRAGISAQVVEGRVARRWLRPLHRGVYLVGPVAPPRAAEMAALLACGPTSALSHGSAAAFWRMTRAGGPPIQVLVVGPVRRRPGLQVRRTVRLYPDEVVRADGLRVTSPARTLYDLARSSGPRLVERALGRALRKELTTRQQLAGLMARYAGRPGSACLRPFLGDDTPEFTRSEAEERFLALIRSAELPKPEVNVRVGPYELDFYWPGRRVAMEVDGYEFHSSPSAFERDRERDAELAARGVRVARVTWRQLTCERDVVLVRLAQTLGPG